MSGKYCREYYQENKERIRKNQRKYVLNNREKEAARSRKYRQKNKEKYNAQNREYNKIYYSIPANQVNKRMSDLTRLSLRRGKGGKTWLSLVPYTLDDLISRLQKTMPEGYGWKDLGGLHIDHIVPISAFNFEKPEDDDFQRCWALSNLRFLPAAENLRKQAKLEKPFQPRLVFH